MRTSLYKVVSILFVSIAVVLPGYARDIEWDFDVLLGGTYAAVQSVAINNAGDVVISGGYADPGVWRVQNGDTEAVRLDDAFVVHVAINDKGTVAFNEWIASQRRSGVVLIQVDGSKLTFDTPGAQAAEWVQIYPDDSVTFHGGPTDPNWPGGEGIYHLKDGVVTPLFNVTFDGTGIRGISEQHDINPAGVLAMQGEGYQDGVFTRGQITLRKDRFSITPVSGYLSNPVINSAGTVAMLDGDRILRVNGSNTEVAYVARSGSYRLGYSIAINGCEDLLFIEQDRITLAGEAIYCSKTGCKAVIGPGYPIDGSTVNSVFSPSDADHFLNDSGDFVVGATLSDGRIVVVRALVRNE